MKCDFFFPKMAYFLVHDFMVILGYGVLWRQAYFHKVTLVGGTTYTYAHFFCRFTEALLINFLTPTT